MASAPWRARQRAGAEGGRVSVRHAAGGEKADSRRTEPPEPPGIDAVLLHLEVQGLVVGSELSSRLALVAPGGLQDPADRLPLGVRCGRLGDLLRGDADE